MGTEQYGCSDIYVAAFLILRGYELLGTDIGPRNVEFFFDRAARDAVQEFHTANPTVQLHDYLIAYRRVKSVMYAERKHKKGEAGYGA